MSVQNIVDKEHNKLLVAGVFKGSKFIKSGMNLLAPEDDNLSETSQSPPPLTAGIILHMERSSYTFYALRASNLKSRRSVAHR
ncbi:hypothetical protein BGZ65_010232 [Modicella reniformis]|uniref:Uncharacterized protein n=1 Tax=Modicella reniformis TaxID=1440133 RepID=A0A9P6IMX1_9FUNG|nr:hypothetical protein BGZ65_010232 [Modicella reniformis]